MVIYFLLSIFLFLIIKRFLMKEKKIIFHKKNNQGAYWVYDQGHYRYLCFNKIGSESQSCIDLNHPEKVVFSYQKLVIAGLMIHPNLKKICILGLGGGTLGMSLEKIFPDVDIDQIEINPEVYEIAKNFFKFNPRAGHQVYIEDGLKYLKNFSITTKYDVIIVDAFDQCSIPPSFLTVDFLDSMKRRLNEDGFVILNTFKKSSFVEQEQRLYRYIFKNIYEMSNLFSLDGNKIMIASKQPLKRSACIKYRMNELSESLKKIQVSKDHLLAQLWLALPE